MSFKERLREEGRQEKEKLKHMSWGDRIWYVWEYYKLHMLGLACILLCIYLIATIFYNRTFTSQLYYLVVNNQNPYHAEFEPLNEQFKAYMNFGKKDLIEGESLTLSFGENGSSEMDYASMAKISALVSGKDLDAMITDSATLGHYAEMDAFLDLEQALPDDLWQQVKETALYAEGADGTEHAYAIDLNHTRFPQETSVQITPCCMGIISNSEHIDNTIAWIRFLLNP